MKIRILQSVIIRGFSGVKPGDVIEVEDRLGREYCGNGWAERSETQPVETREPGFIAREPQIQPSIEPVAEPKKRGRKSA